MSSKDHQINTGFDDFFPFAITKKNNGNLEKPANPHHTRFFSIFVDTL